MTKGSTKESVNSQTITPKVNFGCNCKGCQKKIQRALQKASGEREEKARGGLRLPNLKKLLFSSKKGKQKSKDDDEASPVAAEVDDDDHDKSSESDASEGHEEEAVQPATETMMTGRDNPYVYGYWHDGYPQYSAAMQQDRYRREREMMMNERERYSYPPPAQGYGQQYNMDENPENCSVM